MPTYNFDGSQQPKNKFDGNVSPEVKTPFESTKLGIAANTIFGLPKAALGVAKDLAQGFARSITSTGLSISNATVGKIPRVGYKPSIPAPIPEDNSAGAKFHRFVYGNEDVKDLATRVVEFENTIKQSPTAKKFGLDKAALPLAFGGVIGSATLDLVPGGVGEKNAVKALLKETTEEGAIKVLKNIGFTDDVAKKFAIDFADADSDVIVKDLLDNAKAVQGGKVFDTYLSEGTTDNVVKEVTQDPLVQQAKNFDNPEDFIKSQGLPVYRGGAEDGKYLSTSKNVAEDFAKNRGGTVSEFVIKPEAKIANYADFPEAQYKNIDDYNISTFSQGNDVKTFQDTVLENDYVRAEKWAKDNGFDAIKLPTEGEVRIINSDSIIPKSQMEDVFKQAKTDIPIGVNVDQATIERGLAARERLLQREKTQYLKKFGENTGELRKNLENVQNYVENLKDIISNDPAKDLWKRIFRYTRVINGSGGPGLEVGLDEILARSLKNPKAPDILKRLDTVITEYGYKDLDEATNGIEKWLRSRAQLKDVQSDKAALVRDFQEARMKVSDKLSLNKFLNDSARETDKMITERDAGKRLANKAKATEALNQKALEASQKGYTPEITKANGGTLPPESRGGVKSPELSFTEWKDKGALSLNRETMERNLERIAGKDAEKVKEFIVAPTRKNETDRIRFSNALRTETRDLVVKKLRIRSGSKEDALVQQLGEGMLTTDELKNLKGVDLDKIKEASKYFRNKYDMLLDKVNAVREKFGYTLIPKRSDYFRHFQEIDDSIRSFGLILREQDLPTELAGITGVFSPGKPFSTAEMQRKGLNTTYSAIKGFDNYLDTISKQIFHIDSVQRGRALEKYIRTSSKAINKIRGKTEGEMAEIKLPNFVSNLHDFTNIVAGKKSALDRAFESMAGRPLYGIANWLGRKTSANMVGANLSSAITNFAPLAQSFATTRKMPAIRGLGEGLLAPFKSSDVIDGLTSSYLTRRFPERNIDLTGTKKAVEVANTVFEVVDKFTAKSIVAGKYYDLVGKGVSKDAAMKAADDYAGRVMSDRSLGNTPNLFNSQSLRFVTQFQTEVNNIYSFLKHDIPQMSDGNKRKIASSLGQFVLYSYLFNSAYQKITGRRPLLDPIYSGMELLGLTPETEDSSPLTNAKIAAGGIIGQLPFVGGITGGRFPISAGVPNIASIMNGESTLTKEMAKPAYFLIPPTGGLQIKKTIEGLNAYMNKGVDTPSGKKKYKIKQTPENLIKAAIFGPSSTDAAQKYYVEQAKKRNKTKGTKKYDF